MDDPAVVKDNIAEVIGNLLKAMVNEPKDIKLHIHHGVSITMIEIEANSRDFGIIIGRKGATIGKIRDLLDIIGQRRDKRYEVITRDNRKRDGLQQEGSDAGGDTKLGTVVQSGEEDG